MKLSIKGVINSNIENDINETIGVESGMICKTKLVEELLNSIKPSLFDSIDESLREDGDKEYKLVFNHLTNDDIDDIISIINDIKSNFPEDLHEKLDDLLSYFQ